ALKRRHADRELQRVVRRVEDRRRRLHANLTGRTRGEGDTRDERRQPKPDHSRSWTYSRYVVGCRKGTITYGLVGKASSGYPAAAPLPGPRTPVATGVTYK